MRGIHKERTVLPKNNADIGRTLGWDFAYYAGGRATRPRLMSSKDTPLARHTCSDGAFVCAPALGAFLVSYLLWSKESPLRKKPITVEQTSAT
jgi:hypothetical protein